MSKFVTISLPEMEQRKFRNWLKQQGSKTNRDCRQLIQKTGRDIVRRAQMFASVNFGFLRASIGSTFTNDRLGVTISAGGMGKGTWVKYAPYVEFGTGSKVVVPSDLKDYAIQFKGSGKRNISQRAQPYFFPAVRISAKEMITRLNQMGFR